MEEEDQSVDQDLLEVTETKIETLQEVIEIHKEMDHQEEEEIKVEINNLEDLNVVKAEKIPEEDPKALTDLVDSVAKIKDLT